jgi:hypothetical protein
MHHIHTVRSRRIYGQRDGVRVIRSIALVNCGLVFVFLLVVADVGLFKQN